jgi:hypothetical protein
MLLRYGANILHTDDAEKKIKEKKKPPQLAAWDRL